MCFKTDKRKIYKTTDGYFTFNKKNRKPRPIAVIDQRDDKAVAIVKFHSAKENRQNVIPNLKIKTKNRKNLTEDSFVEDRVIISRKKDKMDYGIYPSDFNETNDRLTWLEYLKIKHKVNADTKQHKKTRNNTIKKWKKHFKK